MRQGPTGSPWPLSSTPHPPSRDSYHHLPYVQTGAVERNLAKIFREKVRVFGAPVQFTQVRASASEGCASGGS